MDCKVQNKKCINRKKIIVIVGFPASGKSTYAKKLLTKYSKSCIILSRDTLGGTIADILPKLKELLESKNKYKIISSGEKLKLYHCTHSISDMFAYLPGDHPYEIAPEVDYDTQFEKSVIDPLNRVLVAVGLQTLNRNLIYSTSLF